MSNEKDQGKKIPPAGTTKFNSMYDDQNEDEMDIDLALKDELAKQGLEYRFIDFKKAMHNGGRSRAGWIIYKRQSEDPRLQGIKSLADPDGLVRQGSMVLAVKPKHRADQQRKRVAMQNRSLSQYNKTVAEELDSKARSLGGATRIIQGYEKNS
jgi:hypothetical protein